MNKHTFPSMYRTSPTDHTIFDKLKLPLFNDINHGQLTHVGDVVVNEVNTVRVFVTCMPAQCWEFEVYNKETDCTYRLSTGSGTLNNYWPSVELIASGMLVVDEIRK
jgi:hypothetical protein